MPKAQDPPSPVDDYEAPPVAVDAGSPPPPPPHSPPPPHFVPSGAPYGHAQYQAPPRQINVLAIIALVASCAGSFIPGAVIAGVIMGHISLGQIKRTGEGGHGLALGAVIAGYAILALELLAIFAYVVFIVFILGVAGAASNNVNFSDLG